MSTTPAPGSNDPAPGLDGINLAREPHLTVWPSRLARLADCGRAYRNQYVLGVPGDGEVESLARDLGTAAHTELEERHNWPSRHDDPELLHDHPAELAPGIPGLLAAHASVCPATADPPSRYLGGEQTLGWRLTDERVLLLATIDALWERPDGTIELRDYKTGANAPDPATDPAASVHALLGRAHWPDRLVRVVYERLGHDPVEAVLQVDDTVLATAAERVRTHAAALRAGDLPARPGPVCRRCEWRRTCPESLADAL